MEGDDPGERMPIIHWPRRRCPFCEATSIVAVRSIDQGDGTREIRMFCRICEKRFIVIEE